jgi:hypothetical protein
MNEGHASLLTLELLDEDAKKAGRQSINCADIEAVRRAAFLRHTHRCRPVTTSSRWIWSGGCSTEAGIPQHAGFILC